MALSLHWGHLRIEDSSFRVLRKHLVRSTHADAAQDKSLSAEKMEEAWQRLGHLALGLPCDIDGWSVYTTVANFMYQSICTGTSSVLTDFLSSSTAGVQRRSEPVHCSPTQQ